MTLVEEFHKKFGSPHPQQPHPGDAALVRLRMRMMREEYEEVRVEMVKLTRLLEHHEPGTERVDKIMATLGLLLKELADLRYVVEGTAVAFGLPFEEAFEEVHRSNMSKTPPDEPGQKAVKGPWYSKADVVRFIPQIIDGTAEEDTTHE